MIDVKIVIKDKDRKVGAMIKALAVEVAGFQAVGGSTKTFLKKQGYYIFHFPHDYQAQEFRKSVKTYISQDLFEIA